MPKLKEITKLATMSAHDSLKFCIEEFEKRGISITDMDGNAVTAQNTANLSMEQATKYSFNPFASFNVGSENPDLMVYCEELVKKTGGTLNHGESSISLDSVTVPSSVIISMLDNQNNNANNSSNTPGMQNSVEPESYTGEEHYYVQDYS